MIPHDSEFFKLIKSLGYALCAAFNFTPIKPVAHPKK